SYVAGWPTCALRSIDLRSGGSLNPDVGHSAQALDQGKLPATGQLSIRHRVIKQIHRGLQQAVGQLYGEHDLRPKRPQFAWPPAAAGVMAEIHHKASVGSGHGVEDA